MRDDATSPGAIPISAARATPPNLTFVGVESIPSTSSATLPLPIRAASGTRFPSTSPGIGVTATVGVPVGVIVGVSVIVLVGVTVGVSVGVPVGVTVGVSVCVGVTVGVSVIVAVGVIVGVSVEVGV
jgi:hypothetical protein